MTFLLASFAFADEFYLEPKAFLDIEKGKWITDKKIKIKDSFIVQLESKKKSLLFPPLYLKTNIFFLA
jgi:hypothetical protein